MATLLQELLDITSDLDSNGIEYAICGGLAMAIHGFARATMDIDVLIELTNLEKTYQVAAKKGFDIKGLEMSFNDGATEIRRVSKIDDDGEILSLDLLLVTPMVEDVWESKEKVSLQENVLSVVSKEGLIKMKSLAGRPQDLADIERLQNDETS